MASGTAYRSGPLLVACESMSQKSLLKHSQRIMTWNVFQFVRILRDRCKSQGDREIFIQGTESAHSYLIRISQATLSDNSKFIFWT